MAHFFNQINKFYSMEKLYKLLVVGLLVSGFNTASAQLIFSEPFDYPVGDLQSKSAGKGFSTAWSRATTDAAATIGDDLTNDKATVVSGSISTANGSGNKAKICVQGGKSTRLDRSLTANTLDGADGSIYWMGFWYNNNLGDTTTYGTAGQLLLMGSANNATATEMRLGFGKTSNLTGVNYFTAFTRASPTGCAAQNWGNNMALSSTGTYYVLVKITKGEFELGTPATKFDGIRVWLLNAPPANEAALASKPNGDLTPLNATTMVPEPIQTKVLRADNTANTTCVRSGVQGIRLRVEGGSNAAFCPEFDEIRLGRTLADITGKTVDVKENTTLSAQIAPNPTANSLNIILDNDAQATKAVVSDMLGRTVLSTQFTGSQTTLNVSNLLKGMYFIHLQSAGKSVTQKFVKE
jgi:Secretion system C-terminal sorting domain